MGFLDADRNLLNGLRDMKINVEDAPPAGEPTVNSSRTMFCNRASVYY